MSQIVDKLNEWKNHFVSPVKRYKNDGILEHHRDHYYNTTKQGRNVNLSAENYKNYKGDAKVREKKVIKIN